MTSYKEIFDLALRLYDDPSLATWPEEDLSNELYSHLQIAIANTPKIRSEVSDRDDFDPLLIDSTGFRMIFLMLRNGDWVRDEKGLAPASNSLYDSDSPKVFKKRRILTARILEWSYVARRKHSN